MTRKYFQPKSLTWWASVAPLVAGVVVATEALHGASSLVSSVNAATGGVPAAALINAGLVGIGLRGAVAEKGRSNV